MTLTGLESSGVGRIDAGLDRKNGSGYSCDAPHYMSWLTSYFSMGAKFINQTKS
jgi:hypothetical protein